MGVRTLRLWKQAHTWSSLICTLFLLVLCVTGLPLVFADEIQAAFAPHPPVASQAAPLRFDRLVALARARYPREVPRFVFPDDDAPQTIVVMGPSADAPPGANHSLTLDSHTGAVLADSLQPGAAGAAPLIAFLLTAHRQLFLGLAGQMFVAAMAVAFLLALVSGVILYAPFARRATFGSIRRGGSRRLRWLDLHNVLGIVVAGWLLVVGGTGLLNALSTPLFGIWEMTDVARILAPYMPHPVVRPVASIDGAVETALAAVPGARLASVTFPSHFQSSPAHYIVWTSGGSPLTSRLETPVMVDARAGALARVVAMPPYLRALEVSRPLHFGDYGGLPLKLLWGAFDLMAILILASGAYLWLVRRWAGADAGPALERDPVLEAL